MARQDTSPQLTIFDESMARVARLFFFFILLSLLPIVERGRHSDKDGALQSEISDQPLPVRIFVKDTGNV
jgi:hypothetical protein